MLEPRWEAVPQGIRNTLDRISRMELLDRFYLAGGTGLALQIGHRFSEDLDLFSEGDPLDAASRQVILRSMTREFGAGNVSVEMEKEGTLVVLLDGGSTSLFHYPYPLMAPLLTLEARIRTAALVEIGLMKVAAIIGKGSKRDFVDLYFVTAEVPLDTLLGLAAKKYPQAHDFSLQALKALAYFEDADRDPPLQLIRPVEWEEVKTYFKKEVARLYHDVGPGP